MLPDGTNGADGAMEAQDSSLIDSILGTSGNTDTAGTGGATSGQDGASGQGYTFAGRQWKGGQSEAEKWANKIYGEFSKHQGTMKELRAAFEADPESLQEAAKDPKWASILGKLGIEVAREEAEEAEAEAQAEGGEAKGYEGLLNEIKMERATMGLEREEQMFERKLGRQLTDEEHNAVMKVISRASSLTMEEAYNLAFHKRMMEEAAKKAGQNARPQNGRPKPPPMHIPGLKVDANKKTTDMSAGEFREHLKNTQEFKDMVSKG